MVGISGAGNFLEEIRMALGYEPAESRGLPPAVCPSRDKPKKRPISSVLPSLPLSAHSLIGWGGNKGNGGM